MAFGGGSIGSAYGQIIIETNKAVANISALRGGLNNFAQQTQSVGFALATLSKSVLGFAGVLAALPIAGVKFFADFEQQMRNVASISPEFAANFDDISDSVIDLSAETGRSAVELASALYDIAQAGFEGAEGLEILAAAADLANAGMTTAKIGAEVLVGILGSGIKDYGGGVLDATRASDLFFQTVFRGNITAEELGQQLGDNLALATALNVSLPEVFTAYDVLTRQKVLPAEAATQINALMSALLKPTEELQAIFESKGYQSGFELLQEGYGGETGLVGAVKFLDELLQGDFGAIEDVSGNIRAIRGIVGLLADDTALWNQEWKAINDSVGATDKALEEQSKSLKYIFNQFKESFKGALIENVEPIIPVLKGILKAGIALIDMWRNMGDSIKNFVSLLLPIGAAVYGVAGILLQLLSRLYTIRTGLAFLGLGITTVLGPLGLLTIGLTVLATAILNNTGGIRGLIAGLAEVINLIKLFGTTRLNSDDLQERVASYERLVSRLSEALGPTRARRIMKALVDVREPTRRLFKQFQRLEQAAENFWHVLTGAADTAEINRFKGRLDALFGPKQGKRIFDNVNKLKSAIGLFGDALRDTLGINVPWQTSFTRWVTDGIAKWGSFAEFMRQEVIPAFGDKFERALVVATNGLTRLREMLPEIADRFEDVRRHFDLFRANLAAGNFQAAIGNLGNLFRRLFEGIDFEGIFLDLKVLGVNLVQDFQTGLANAENFVRDVLAGMGFDVATGQTGGTVGYKIGQITATIGGWLVDGAKDLGAKIGQFMNDMLGLGSDLTGGPGMDNPSLTKDIGRATINILGWTITAAKTLSSELNHWLDEQIGGRAGGGVPSNLFAGSVGTVAGYRDVGAVGVRIAEWTITGLEFLITELDAWWTANQGAVKDKIFKIPKVIGEITEWGVEMAAGAPGLGETIQRYLAIFAIAAILAPFGIPTIAVSIAGFLVQFGATALSDFVQFVVNTLKEMGIGPDDIGSFPVTIKNILFEFVGDLADDFKRELSESAIIINDFTGWTLELDGPQITGAYEVWRWIKEKLYAIPPAIVDAYTNWGISLGAPVQKDGKGGVEVDTDALVTAMFTSISDSLGSIDGTEAAGEILAAGEKIGLGIIELLSESITHLFEASDAMSAGAKAVGGFAITLVAGLAKGIVLGIGENFAAEIESRLSEDATLGDFGMAILGALMEWLVNALKATWAVGNILTLGIPGAISDLVFDMTEGIADLFVDALTGETITLPGGLPGQIGLTDPITGDMVGPVEVDRPSIANKIAGALVDGLAGLEQEFAAFQENPFSYITEQIINWINAALDGLEALPSSIAENIPDWLFKLIAGDWRGALGDVIGMAGGPQAKPEFKLGERLTPILSFEEPQNYIIDPKSAEALYGEGVLAALGIDPDVKEVSPFQYQLICDSYGICQEGYTPAEGSVWDFPEDGGAVEESAKKFMEDVKANRDRLQNLLGDQPEGLLGKFDQAATGVRAHLNDFARNVEQGGGDVNTKLRGMADKLRHNTEAIRGIKGGGKITSPTVEVDDSAVTGKIDRIKSSLQQAASSGSLQFAAMILRASAFASTMSQIFVGIATAMTNFGTIAGQGFANTFGPALDGSVAHAGAVAVSLTAIMVGIAEMMTNMGMNAGDGFAYGLANGMANAVGVVQNGLAQIAGAVAGFSLNSQGQSIGASLGDGIAAGIQGSISAVASAAAALVGAALDAANDAAENKSPSHLFAREVGVPIGLGMAEGITRMIPAVEAASQDAIYAALGAANGAITNGAAGAAYGSGPTAPVNVYVNPKINELDDVKQVIEFFRVLPAHMATI